MVVQYPPQHQAPLTLLSRDQVKGFSSLDPPMSTQNGGQACSFDLRAEPCGKGMLPT